MVAVGSPTEEDMTRGVFQITGATVVDGAGRVPVDVEDGRTSRLGASGERLDAGGRLA